jgi:hypothetical protein
MSVGIATNTPRSALHTEHHHLGCTLNCKNIQGILTKMPSPLESNYHQVLNLSSRIVNNARGSGVLQWPQSTFHILKRAEVDILTLDVMAPESL